MKTECFYKMTEEQQATFVHPVASFQLCTPSLLLLTVFSIFLFADAAADQVWWSDACF